MNMTLIYLNILELTLFYLLMFLIILFLVYFDFMLSVVRLELCLCIGSYIAYSIGRWVSGRYCVGEVRVDADFNRQLNIKRTFLQELSRNRVITNRIPRVLVIVYFYRGLLE